MEQNGRRLDRQQGRIGIQFNMLRGYPELRFFHHLSIHLYPATLDIQLGLAARTGDHFGETFGESQRFGHEEYSA